MLRLGVGMGCVLGLLAVAAPGASAASLYDGPPPRPGPEILYRKPAPPPQLSNHGVWHANPILVSGTSAYRGGEFLYQDFLYDDHGAKGLSRDPGDPRVGGDSFSAPNGTYTYPADPEYANNAADLVELRVKPLADATAFRISLNTIRNPALVGTTIAIGGSEQPREFPHGANASAPASLFLTVHGGKADLIDAASGQRVTPAPRVATSTPGVRSTCRSPIAPGTRVAARFGSPPGSASGTRQPTGTWCRAQPPTRAIPAALRAWPTRPPSSTSPSVSPSHGSTRFPPTRCSPTRPGGATGSRERRSPTAT